MYKTKLYKAFISSKITPEVCEELASVGADGTETTATDLSLDEARDVRRLAESFGLRIHSIMRGGSLNHPDAEERRQSKERIKNGLRVAAAYGADAMLVVPGRIELFGPKPSEIRLDFDPQTLVVRQIVEGDNSAFQDYIDLQNEATALVRRELEEIIPVAAYEGVTIALENVWNNLWTTPEFSKALIESFDSRWVKNYFDVGNNIKYAPCEKWLETLGGKNIVKLHFKDFLVDPESSNGGWFENFKPIGQGTIDWIAVRNKIEEIGYSGWVTLEDVDHFSKKQHIQILDEIFNGKEISLR